MTASRGPHRGPTGRTPRPSRTPARRSRPVQRHLRGLARRARRPLRDRPADPREFPLLRDGDAEPRRVTGGGPATPLGRSVVASHVVESVSAWTPPPRRPPRRPRGRPTPSPGRPLRFPRRLRDRRRVRARTDGYREEERPAGRGRRFGGVDALLHVGDEDRPVGTRPLHGTEVDARLLGKPPHARGGADFPIVDVGLSSPLTAPSVRSRRVCRPSPPAPASDPRSEADRPRSPSPPPGSTRLRGGASETSSSGPRTTPTSVPGGTSSPTSTSTRARVPSWFATTSAAAVSDSTTATTWSVSTGSPSPTTHSAISPVSIVLPIIGIRSA